MGGQREDGERTVGGWWEDRRRMVEVCARNTTAVKSLVSCPVGTWKAKPRAVQTMEAWLVKSRETDENYIGAFAILN